MTLKRVLISYFPRPPIGEYLKRAFEKHGIEAEIFYSDVNSWFDRYVIHYTNKLAHNMRLLPKSRVLFQDHPLSHLQFRSGKLLEKAREFRPDLVFIVRGWRFTEAVLREIKRSSVIFGWWIEKEERMEEAFKELNLFDHYFFMNSSCVTEGRKRGLEAISLLPHSVDRAAFYPMDIRRRYDWSFVGRWSDKRRSFIEKAMEVSANGALYGPKWKQKTPFNSPVRKVLKGDYLEGRELVRLYNESRVVLNITNWGFGGGAKRSGMNMRVLEVPACGTCLLTDGSKDLARVVSPGEHVALYEGLDDFATRLKALLDDAAGRERLAKAGYNHVISNYTYDNVVETIMAQYSADTCSED